MDELRSLPEGWEVWAAEEGGRVVLAFRPDVFDAEAFPPACLPTITVAPGSSPNRPIDERERSGRWHVALYLEPDVAVSSVGAAFETRAEAVEAAVDAAGAFAAGEVDYRGAYLEPRPAYLAALDGLVGRES